jgi:general stress protein 26
MAQLLPVDDTQAHSEDHLVDMLRTFDNALLITRTHAGALHGRPMGIAELEDDGTIWFITDIESKKLQEIEEDPSAMVALQSDKRYITINGTVEAVPDRAKVRELWKDAYRIWFRNENDPDMILLRFTPSEAEYWDNSGVQGLRYALRAARAYVSGNPMKQPSPDPESHAKLKHS